MYLLRLDDASEYMDAKKWDRIEELLDKYNVKPIVGIIPECRDPKYYNVYKKDEFFWKKALLWQDKGWIIAQHGYQHIYCSNDGGINPYVKKSEFAGLAFEEQKEKIQKGNDILRSYGIHPKVFFAPSHTFDGNTLKAIYECTDIRIISDTLACDIYKHNNFYFIPMQTSIVRNVPFRVSTFCYHPNTMDEASFAKLEAFIKKNRKRFLDFDRIVLKNRKRSFFDDVLRYLYFAIRKYRKIK